MTAYRWRGIDPDTGTDYDAERFERAKDEVIGDEDQCKEIGRIVATRYAGEIEELCQGVYSEDGAADVARGIARFADEEIERRARNVINNQDEEAALSRAGL